MSDFRVVSAGEVADQIVARLAGMQIPADHGDWVKEQARHGERWGQFTLGWGPNPFTMSYKLKPDGRIELQLQDVNASPFWNITLRPAERPPVTCPRGHPVRPDGSHLSVRSTYGHAADA